MGEEAIERGREAFRPIALRGAVCFDTVQHLREVHPLYQLSFRQFLYIYDTSIAHSDRMAHKIHQISPIVHPQPLPQPRPPGSLLQKRVLQKRGLHHNQQGSRQSY